jgi:type II secretory pathway pseudopilin PulG
MRQATHRTGVYGPESGYALLAILFFLAILVLSLAAAAPTVLSSIQRQKEKQMVWRGKQYERGIRLYYSKMKRLPTSLEDLTTPKTGTRFMRQAYKDPMNPADGSWRLIYVSPNGKLIGSLNENNINLTLFGSSNPGSTNGSAIATLLSSTGTGFMNTNSGSSGSSGFGMRGGIGTASTIGIASATAVGTDGQSSTNDPGQPQPLGGPMDASNTFGGSIIGVGSKIDKKSFLVYQKARNYQHFEFIWDPLNGITLGPNGAIVRSSAGIGTPVQNMNGGNVAGTAPAGSPSSTGAMGMDPGQNASQTQNPAQEPSQNKNPGTPPNDP